MSVIDSDLPYTFLVQITSLSHDLDEAAPGIASGVNRKFIMILKAFSNIILVMLNFSSKICIWPT